MGIWLELVTLLIPGFNDSDDELKRLTEFVAGVSPDIPWHVTAFHGDYKMTDPGNTTAAACWCGPPRLAPPQDSATCTREISRGVWAALEHTHCPQCRERLIERYGYLIRGYNLTPAGACPSCGTQIPGLWSDVFTEQRTAFPMPIRFERGSHR